MTLTPEYLAFLAKYWPLFVIIAASIFVTIGITVKTFNITNNTKAGKLINFLFNFSNYVYGAVGVITIYISIFKINNEQITLDQFKLILIAWMIAAFICYLLLITTTMIEV